MKTYRKFLDVPSNASYIGSTYPDGSMDEETADHIDAAWEPVQYIDQEGVKHFFDVGDPA